MVAWVDLISGGKDWLQKGNTKGYVLGDKHFLDHGCGGGYVILCIRQNP